MRIALITPGGVPRAGDPPGFAYLLALIERLARRHDLHVFALHQGPQPERYALMGARVYTGGAHGPERRRAYRRVLGDLLREHRRRSFDVVHAMWLVPPGMLAAIARVRMRRPVLVHVAGGELVAMPDIGYGWRVSRRGRLWTRLALAGATRISAASLPVLDQIARLGYQADRIPFGVDLARWPPRAPRARRPGAPARLLHIGNLNPVKDQATLLQAAAALARQGVDFQLDVAGLDTTGGAVPALATRLGLDDRVRFHGFLPAARLRPLVDTADLLVMSSRHEAGPFALLEAAVAGVPAVGTAVGHFQEWTPHAAGAVPPADAEALAREVARLLSDEPRRLAIAAEAQRRAVAEDADWTAGRVEAVYGEMVTSPASAASGVAR
jgi:glycosyltransferase involved in cell wall biosynthesis